MGSPRGTPARLRAQGLAEEWRAADAALQLLTARRELAEQLRAARDNGRSLLVVTDSAGIMTAPPRLLDSAAHLAWHQLGLGETKIAVALVTKLAVAARPRDRPAAEEDIAAYLGPDSTDRITCVAVVPAGRYWTRYVRGDLNERLRSSFDQFAQSVKAAFGPCAFYAAYGTPSHGVRRWLGAHDWDLALTLRPGPRTRQAGSLIGAADPYPWYWDAIYSLPPGTVGCLALRPESCGSIVLDGSDGDADVPVPDFMRINRRRWLSPRLVEGYRFLGDVAQTVSRDRFLSFWTTAQPVDTALASALREPVGEWTAAWQQQFAQPIRLGPMPPLRGLGLACVIGLLAVGIVTVAASRRQVR